jgi:hypothetical protein
MTTKARDAWKDCAYATARTYAASESAIDRATVAVGRCSHLKPAIMEAIKAENGDSRLSALYADAYMKAAEKRLVTLVADSLMRGS